MPLHKGSSKAVISNNINEMVKSGYPQKQAVAASLHNADEYAEGGEVDENEKLMDHCALECIEAIHNKDKSAFKDALHVLMADMINKMSSDEGESNADVSKEA